MNAPADSDSVVVLEGAQALLTAALECIGNAQRGIALFSYALDARVFGDEVFVERLQAFVLSHERARVRILVNRPELALRNAPRLIELARRASSRIHCRQLSQERQSLIEEYLVSDERATLYRDRYDQLQAQWHPQAPLQARRRLKDFNPLWEESLPAREFSELRI